MKRLIFRRLLIFLPMVWLLAALAFILVAQGWGYAWVWPIGLAAGGSLIWHASVYDVSKNIEFKYPRRSSRMFIRCNNASRSPWRA